MEKLSRIVLLASGRGSNFAALADAIQNKQIPNAEATALICNKKGAEVIAKAEQRGIPCTLIESSQFVEAKRFNRQRYEVELLKELARLKPDWILLAGYMLILGREVIQAYPGKIINIHPSLLPLFRGLHPLQQALDSKMPETGCTVHVVTEELDAGPILAQSRLPILPGDTEASLAQRLLPLEHQTYIEAVRRLQGV